MQHRLYVDSGQGRGIADPRQHQELWRPDSASAEDNFAVALGRLPLAVRGAIPDPRCARRMDDDPFDQR